MIRIINQFIKGVRGIKRLLDKNIVSSPLSKRSTYNQLRNYYPPPYQEKTLGIYSILKYISTKTVYGDMVECGVGRGSSLFTIANISNLIGLDRKLYGFDSFQGFPEPTMEDKSFRNPQKGEWNDTSLQHVSEHFKFGGLEKYYYDNVTLIPGFFEKTLPITEINSISFLHLDCDLYDSYKTCIKYLYPKLTPDSIVMYDEYNHPKWPGATKAIDESLLESNRCMFYSNLNKKYLSFYHDTLSSADFLKLQKELFLQAIEK